MVCQDCNENIKKFPSELQCLLWGYTVTYPKPILGFAGRTALVSNPTISIESITIDTSKHSLFMIWYMDELNYGANPFLLDITLYGLKKEWVVEFENNSEITEKIKNSNMYFVDFKLKIAEDVPEALKEAYCNKCEVQNG